jgi:hypothetical protein
MAKSKQRRRDLPNELGLPSLAGLVYLLGAPWGYEVLADQCKHHILTMTAPWLWWFLTSLYFLCSFVLVAKVYFVGVEHYADYRRKAGSGLFVGCDALVVTIMMTSQAVVREPSVRHELLAVGFPHLDWVLFGGAVLVFAHVTTLVTPAATTEEQAAAG